MKTLPVTPFILLFLFFSCGEAKEEGVDQTRIIEVPSNAGYEMYTLSKTAKELDLADTSAFLAEIRTCSINEPRPLGSLNSGSKKFVHVIDKNNIATASLFGIANLALKDNERLAIVDYVQYLDTICTPGSGPQTLKNIRLAAGVRLFLKINRADKKVSLNIPSKVAAAAEFNLAEATFTIETIGFATAETRNILSRLGESFNVESYVSIMGAVRDVMKTMKDSTEVKPVLIPIQQ